MDGTDVNGKRSRKKTDLPNCPTPNHIWFKLLASVEASGKVRARVPCSCGAPRLHEKVRNLIPKMLMQACPDERQFFHAPSDAMDPKHGWIHQSCQAQAIPNCMFLLQEANNWCSRFRHHFRTQQSHAHPVKQACGMPDPFRSDVMKPHADQIGLKFAVIWLAFALRMKRAALQLGHSFPWPRGSSTVPDCRLQAEPGQGYFRFRAASVLFYNRLA